MNETKKTTIPTWVWVLGCLFVLVTGIGCAVLTGGLAAYFFLAPASTTVTEITEVAPAATLVAPALVSTATPVAQDDDQASALPPTNTPAPAEPTETPQPSATSAVSADPFAKERREIEENVVDIRGLLPREAITLTLLTTTELRQRLEEELADDYGPEEAADDTLVLSAFDFVAPDFDLYTFTLDLYTEQIAGYYDPETAEFVVISDDDEFDPLEQWTHAHEYVHALQDQYYDLALLEDDSLDSEASMALRALAEGDASLVQTFYLMEGYFSEQELADIFGSLVTEQSTDVLDSAPPVLARELAFPYIDGLSFAQTLFAAEGFEGIDAAWLDPPRSTEHILHPERYFSGDQPQLVSLAPLTDTLGAGWRRVDEDVLGELYLREYLIQQLPEAAVDQAATGWGGDRYALYQNEESGEIVLALALAWDSADDRVEFAQIYAGYPEGLFGVQGQTAPDGGRCWLGGEVICLYQAGELSLVVRAPDAETAAAVAAALAP